MPRHALGRFALVLSLIAASVPGQEAPRRAAIDAWTLRQTADGGEAEFLVLMREQADVTPAAQLPTKEAKGNFVYEALRTTAVRTQGPLVLRLRELGVPHRSFLIVNGLWVRAGRSVVIELSERPEVARIEGCAWSRGIADAAVRPTSTPSASADPSASLPVVTSAASPAIPTARAVEPGVAAINAPAVWTLGFTGQGIVIGNQDTGMDWTHPAIQSKYRGWNGTTAIHDFHWHDSIHTGGGSCGFDQPAPCDDHGHGTHTVGTHSGDDGLANQIGVAPGTQWIGSRNMDQGNGTPATYLESFEFFLAPYPIGGSPFAGNPALAPHVTSNSWLCPASEGCAPTTLLLACQNQRAAGILTVFAAGNSGPGCSTTDAPPGIYDEVFTVGAHRWDNLNLAGFSSRGPVTADGSGRSKPDIAAPGVSVRSSLPNGAYASWSGTSMATPHVAGAAALLLSAHPALIGQVALTEQILGDTAVAAGSTASCGGTADWNHEFGRGRLDVMGAVMATYDATLTSVGPSFPGGAGGAAVATLTLTNTGYLSDTYAIVVAGPYASSTPASVGPIAPGTSATVVVTVVVPSSSPPAALGTFTVSATSQAFALVVATAAFDAVTTSVAPTLAIAQPLGPGTGVVLQLGSLVPGAEVFTVFSFEACGGGPGTGPYLGLCASDVSTLVNQLLLPLGAVPFHFSPNAPAATFGPYPAPSGLYVEAVCFDFTGGLLRGASPVAAFGAL